MPRPSKIVEYQDDDLTVRLVVQRADVRAGIERTRLQLEADAQADEAWGLRVLRRHTYPDLMSATTEVTGIPWPLTFEDYLALPEPLGIAWENAVYQVNPHWLPPPAEPDEDKKKSPTTSTGD